MRSSRDTGAMLVLAFAMAALLPTPGLADSPGETPPHSSFLELRIYQSLDGQRDRFLNYFEKHYLESQEAEGMRIWGQFRDLDNANHFVWMRGYPTFEQRPGNLMSFYSGPVWGETSAKVGEMLASSAHVHFLEPVSSRDALDDRFERSPKPHQVGVIVAQLFPVENNAEPLIERIREALIPAYLAAGATTLGLFESSDKKNNEPRLPYIEDEPVVVWMGSFPDRAAFEAARKELRFQPDPTETFVLEPGSRSRLYHRGG